MYISDEAVLGMERARAKLVDILKNKDVNVSEDEGMCSLVNKVDKIGKNYLLHSIMDYSITEFSDEEITNIPDHFFSKCTELHRFYAPNVTLIGNGAFGNCSKLSEINVDNCEVIKLGAFRNINLPQIFLPKLITMDGQNYGIKRAFFGKKVPLFKNLFSSVTVMLVLLDKEIYPLSSADALSKSCIIYVPKMMADGTDGIEAYQQATNWAARDPSTYLYIEENIDEILKYFPRWNYEEWLANQTGGGGEVVDND